MSTLTVDQARVNLERANYVRIGISQVKDELAAGELTLEQALADPRAGRCTVAALLRSLPRFGPLKVAKICGRLELQHHARVEHLSPTRRVQLLRAVAGKPVLDITELQERILEELQRAPGGRAAVAHAIGSTAVKVGAELEALEGMRLVREIGRPGVLGVPLYSLTAAGVAQLAGARR